MNSNSHKQNTELKSCDIFMPLMTTSALQEVNASETIYALKKY